MSVLVVLWEGAAGSGRPCVEWKWGKAVMRAGNQAEESGDGIRRRNQAVLTTASPSSCVMRSRITNFCTLPVIVIGISATKRI